MFRQSSIQYANPGLSKMLGRSKLDSPDHKGHVAYPESGPFESNGPCPASHTVKIPQVMYEVMWDTRAFNDKSLWSEDGGQPFVYSMGDP